MATYDRYRGPAYEIVRVWRKHDSLPDVVAPWPAIKVSGYSAEFVADSADSTPQAGYVEVDGLGRLEVLLLRRSPGWEVHYAASGCTYSFGTVFDAMAHAVWTLV